MMVVVDTSSPTYPRPGIHDPDPPSLLHGGQVHPRWYAQSSAVLFGCCRWGKGTEIVGMKLGVFARKEIIVFGIVRS